jgi:Zn-dependent peptidase ImmA (M78 family)
VTDREFAAKIASLLETLGLSGPPLTEPHLRAIAGHLGFELRLDQVMKEEGLTTADTREIRIRRGLSPARQLFTIAHELAHVLRGHDLSFARARDGREPAAIRREADAGASVMLMFGPWLKAKIRELGTDDPAVLAPLFGVSTEAMAIRIKNCQRQNLLTVIEGGGATAAPRDPGLTLVAPPQSPSRYEYSAREWAEIERAARLAFPSGTVLHRASLAEDLGGVDAVYRVNHRCDLQIRVRHNRPAYAADKDVAFRATEPAMIADGTYAPLAFFLWMVNGYIEAGKLIDVYRMAEQIDPPLGSREPKAGPYGQFYLVTIAELHDCGALLMMGGRGQWAPARLGGARDVLRLLTRHLEDSQ